MKRNISKGSVIAGFTLLELLISIMVLAAVVLLIPEGSLILVLSLGIAYATFRLFKPKGN